MLRREILTGLFLSIALSIAASTLAQGGGPSTLADRLKSLRAPSADPQLADPPQLIGPPDRSAPMVIIESDDPAPSEGAVGQPIVEGSTVQLTGGLLSELNLFGTNPKQPSESSSQSPNRNSGRRTISQPNTGTRTSRQPQRAPRELTTQQSVPFRSSRRITSHDSQFDEPRVTPGVLQQAPEARPESSGTSRRSVLVASRPDEPQTASVTEDEQPQSRAIRDETSTPVREENEGLLVVTGPQIYLTATGPKRITVSREANFAVKIRNDGREDARDVVVYIGLPRWADVSGTSPTTGTMLGADVRDSTEPLRWHISNLAAGANEVLNLELIPRESRPMEMSVRWTHERAGSVVQVEVEEPMLHMVVSGPSDCVFGETKMYSLTISNPGTGDAENVEIQLLPLGGRDDSVSTHELGTLKHGESKTLQVELEAGKAGTLHVKARAVAEGGLTAEASKEVLVRRAELKVVVEGMEAQYAGNNVNYRVVLSNPGSATAEKVAVAAVLPRGIRYINSSHDGRFDARQARLSWEIDSVSAGQTIVLELSCEMESPGDQRLRVAAQDDKSQTVSSAFTTSVFARADLKLIVTDPRGPMPVGEEAEYEVRIVNRGTKAAEGIDAVVFFSEGIEPTRVGGAQHQIGVGQVVFKTIPTLAAGAELVFKIKARASQSGDHVFRSEVVCRSLGTKLAAQETTHFYGKDIRTAESQRQLRTASRPQLSPTPAAPLQEDEVEE